MVASRGTADGLASALILATLSAVKGMETYICFPFGGTKLLTKASANSFTSFLELEPTKEHFKQLLSTAGMPSLSDMLKQAKESGVKTHVCSPTVGLFGTKKEDLVGVVDDVIGASGFLQLASDPDALTLFI